MSGTNHPAPNGQSTPRKLALLALALLALGTVFVLPSFVSGPWFSGSSEEEPESAATDPAYVSPTTAAEKTHYRQESQRVLAQYVAARDRLLERQVEAWAAVDFNQSLERVAKGDEQYSYGEYRSALDNYQQALDTVTSLETLGEEKLRTALEEGFAAVQALNVATAEVSSGLASIIAPRDPEVQKLSARVTNLPALVAHMEDGERASAARDLAAAEAAYVAATNLDPEHEGAAAALAAIRGEKIDSRFRGHMSRGYAALDSGDYDGAESAFREAGTVYPGNPAIAQALAQVENRRSGELVSEQIASALEHEAREEWSEALAIYEALLEQDPTLTDARVKLIPARVRADLDARLNRVFDDPLKLSDQSFYRGAQATLADARGIPNPGENLAAQIGRLDVLLKAAVSSVTVEFESDNLTTVTLYRVRELGQFERTSLRLRPGRYIAAGTRKGFRDVRVEFIVTGETQEGPIVVRCVEPI